MTDFRIVDPSTKLTNPDGVPAPPGPATVAVNVTAWPTTEGFIDVRSVVVVGALTVCVKGEAALEAKVLSPS